MAGRIAYGTLGRIVGRLAGALLTLEALRLATHYFGPREWGSISAALAWVAVFAALGSSGITTYTMREVARGRSDRGTVFGSAVRAVTAVAVVAALIALVLGRLVYWRAEPTYTLVLVLCAWIPLAAWFQLGGGVLAALGRSDVRGVLDAASSALLLLGTILVVHAGWTPLGYVLLVVTSVGLSALLALGAASLRIHPRWSPLWRGDLRFISAAIPFGQVAILASVYSRADSIMLYLLRGRHAIAIYAVAYQVITFVSVAPTFLAGALLKDFMEADSDRQLLLSRHALNISLAVAAPLPFVTWVFARPFIFWLAGPRFVGSVSVLIILSFAGSLALVNAMLFQLAVYADTRYPLWRIVLVVTVVNLLVNAISIIIFGPRGAALALVVSEVVGLFFYWRIFRDATSYRLSVDVLLSIGVSVAVIVMAWSVLHELLGIGPGSGISMLPRAALLLVLYVLLLLGVGRVTRRLASGDSGPTGVSVPLATKLDE